MHDNGYRTYLLVGGVFGALLLSLGELGFFIAAHRFIEHMADVPSEHLAPALPFSVAPVAPAPVLHDLCA